MRSEIERPTPILANSTSFFGDFEKYNRFHRTDDRSREAMAHLRVGRLAEAEAALQQVVDPEEREPAFRRAGVWNESSQL